MKKQLTELAQRWRRDADQYQRQVEESRAKGLPHDQMLSMMTSLRSCARDIETSVAAMPNMPSSATPQAGLEPRKRNSGEQ
jgi:hypothetical protein